MKSRPLLLSCADVFPVAQQLMQEGISIRLTVSGNSMWPLLRHNRDAVLINSLSRPVRIGDIVLVRFDTSTPKYLLHRVIRLHGEDCVTAGDGNTFMDGMIPTSQIIGKVERVFRGSLMIDCSSAFWRFLFTGWRLCFPLRKFLLKGLKTISRWKAGVRSFRKMSNL